MPQEPMLYILLGAAIALVGSVLATWVQGTITRRASARESAQAAIHELWRLFIDERESEGSTGTSIRAGRGLGDAELLTATITDRRIRERVILVLRLLRESALPEMEELSGTPAARARQELCTHVLDVLGTQLRNERLPALPENIQGMRRVESQALKIRAGGVPVSRAVAPTPAAEDESEAASTSTTVSRSKARRRPRTTQPSSESSTSSGSAATDSTPASSS